MKKALCLLLLCAGSTAFLNAQSTDPSPYCYAGFKDKAMNSNDWIDGVEIMGKLNNFTSDENGDEPHYTFYNNIAVPTLSPGTNYSFILSCHVSAGVVGYAAWIDINQNHVFEDNERFAGIKANVGFPFVGDVNTTAVFAIPSSALNGQTRMRIRISEDDDYHAAHPGAYELACDSIAEAWGGETEDYIVNIAGATDPTGINDVTVNYGLSVFPNPAKDVLMMTTDIPASLSYTIYNMTGAKVVSGKLSKSNNGIDIAAFNNGIYFIEAFDKDVLVGRQKFIKQ